MYLERNTTGALLEVVEQNGYASKEANMILSEMEYSKRAYDRLIHSKNRASDTMADYVVGYYLHLCESLRREIPYDAMGDYVSIPLMILQEFSDSNIIERIETYYESKNVLMDSEELGAEIQKFVTTELDPQGIILYMDILKNGQEKTSA